MFRRRLISKLMQVFQFRPTKVEADDYGNGKYETGICQRIENQAGYGT